MVQLIELFEKYVNWKVLAHFMKNPSSSFHVKELARTLGISPGSASTAVKKFESSGYLLKEEKGLAHMYELNPEHPAVGPMKKAFGLMRVLALKPAEKFLEVDQNIVSLALFGSYVDGTYDEKSDLDILVITPSRADLGELGRKLEGEFGSGVSITALRLSQWQQLARKNDPLYKRIIENHVLFYGSRLI